ncbi:MAG: UpxY family transcription antiterminator [Bacteroidaceae bacterium]|nr:UpxY family transcription antiterminator [Bacteroidaceae bacterium]
MLNPEATTSKPTDKDSQIVWFAMSAPYRRELKAKEYLQAKGIECFVPMVNALVEKRCGAKIRKQVPAIHNLIFVHTSKNVIQEIKRGVDYLQYRTMPRDGKNIPIIVPDRQMQQFITVTQTTNEELIYMRPEEVNIAKGTKVRVHGGAFDGTEGVFVKIQGKRKPRLVLFIQGVAAVALAEISTEFIEIIK